MFLHSYINISMPRKQAYSSYPVKKTGSNQKKLTFDERFEGVTTTPLILDLH